VYVVAALQDPRKDVLPFRDLFPTRIGLRLTEPAQVDLVLGDGMRERGALCDRIPMSLPGTAFVVLDGAPGATRARASYWTDADIAELAREYGWLRVIDGDWDEGAA
jgi:S-DNA-T family DNA segregation ATPase FtsK/SpoIIIE